MLSIIFLLAALILFLIATFNVASRINLLAAGLSCWVLSDIIARGLLN